MIKLKYNWICFYLAITVILLILKATDVVNWSWWIIMLPVYLPVVTTVLFFIIMGFVIHRNTK